MSGIVLVAAGLILVTSVTAMANRVTRGDTWLPSVLGWLARVTLVAEVLRDRRLRQADAFAQELGLGLGGRVDDSPWSGPRAGALVHNRSPQGQRTRSAVTAPGLI